MRLANHSPGAVINCLFRTYGPPFRPQRNPMAHTDTRRFLKVAGALLTGLVLAACGKQEAPATAASAPAAAPSAAAPAPKVYTVGTDAAYAPFEFQNEKGEIVGFSDAYFDAIQLIAVKEASKVAKFDDLKKLKVGVQTGTTGDEVVTKLQGKTATTTKRFESTPLALKELEAGGADAVVADNGVVIHYVANNPDAKFKTVADTKSFAPEQYGIAVKKGNAELMALVNKGLAAVKADGTYAAIYKKTFGTEPAAAAAPASAASASN